SNTQQRNMSSNSPASTAEAQKIRIADARHHEGERVEIQGWLYNLRKSGKIVFPIIRDGSGLMQCVAVKNNLPEDVFNELKGLTQESSFSVTGTIRAEARAIGGYELDVSDARVFHRVSEEHPYPITPKEHGVDFLMDHRHLWLRSRRQHAAIRVRHEVIRASRDYLDSNGFTLVDTPIFTPAACEGTTTLFEVDYFGDEKVYLTQSGQLYNEANAMAFGKVYCFGPTFRAEKSKTRRHLSEFWMVEPEWAFGTLDDYMNVAEQMVSSVVQTVLQERAAELKVLERDTTALEKIVPPFPRIAYDEAVEILRAKSDPHFKWGDDFGAPDETTISEQFDRPVFVHHYPTDMKAFYLAPDPERPEVCLSADLLAPEGYGEIIGGGQRSDNLEYLEAQLVKHNLPRAPYEWYLDLRKYGSVPHCGFGLGIERTVAWLCKLDHVRETIAFPR